MSGRPTKWSPDLGERMVELASQGMVVDEICRAVGINRTSFFKYQGLYVDFANAIKEAKSRVDDTVEASLLRRARGYETTETEGEPIYVTDPETGLQTQQGVRITKVKRVHIEANVTAQIFWLKNRRGKDWRDQFNVHQTFDPGKGLEGITPEDEIEVAQAVAHILGPTGGNGDGR